MRCLPILAALPLIACTPTAVHNDPDKIVGAGTGTSRTFAVADFTGVELAGADDVDVSVGTAFSVRAEGPSEQLDRLLLKKVGAVLSVGNERGGSTGDVKVFVTMPAVELASLSGAGDLHVDVVKSPVFQAALAGAGGLSVDMITATSTKLDIAGSGTIKAKGTVEQLTMSVAGSGNIDAAYLTATGATVSVAGSGNATATVNGPAMVSSTGSGNITLGRSAVCTTKTTGSGEVHCG